MSEPNSASSRGSPVHRRKSAQTQSDDQNVRSRWSAMAEFDAAEADMAQVQTRPVDTVRAEEEELLESNKPSRPPRERGHQFPSSNRLATGGLAKAKLTPEELAERMDKMKLKNEQLVARRLRTEADENQYKEHEEARQVAQKEQRTKMKMKREDDNRIQSAIDRQRDEVRQRKLGKTLEWDQDKPTLDEDDALPAEQRYYNNDTRRGRGNYEGRGRGRGRYGGTRGRGGSSYGESADQQTPPSTDDQNLWPALPPATSS